MLRIAGQSKGRLYDETMEMLSEAGIKLSAVKRSLLVPSRNFPVEILYLRDDDIPDAVATGTADVGIVGYNEVLEKQRDVKVLKRLGFSRCRLSLAVPNKENYTGLEWFNGKKVATSYPVILRRFFEEKGGFVAHSCCLLHVMSDDNDGIIFFYLMYQFLDLCG